jgi:hypothetical protein
MLSSAMSDTKPIETAPGAHAQPASRIAVPQHVVYRHFPSETVVFNLQTGQYHGLNATAGSMLAELERAVCLRDAAAAVAAEYMQPPAIVEQDMRELCDALLARGLIEFDGEPAG